MVFIASSCSWSAVPGQRTGTAIKGGCKGLPVGRASTGGSAASEERSRLCMLPAPCHPSAEEPSDGTGRGRQHPARLGRLSHRPRGRDRRWPPPQGPGVLRSATVGTLPRCGRGDLGLQAGGGQLWWGGGASCRGRAGRGGGRPTPLGRATPAGPGWTPPQLRRLATPVVAAGGRAGASRHGGVPGACLVLGGPNNAATCTTTGAPYPLFGQNFFGDGSISQPTAAR
jgi:hypothetical protein